MLNLSNLPLMINKVPSRAFPAPFLGATSGYSGISLGFGNYLKRIVDIFECIFVQFD